MANQHLSQTIGYGMPAPYLGRQPSFQTPRIVHTPPYWKLQTSGEIAGHRAWNSQPIDYPVYQPEFQNPQQMYPTPQYFFWDPPNGKFQQMGTVVPQPIYQPPVHRTCSLNNGQYSNPVPPRAKKTIAILDPSSQEVVKKKEAKDWKSKKVEETKRRSEDCKQGKVQIARRSSEPFPPSPVDSRPVAPVEKGPTSEERRVNSPKDIIFSESNLGGFTFGNFDVSEDSEELCESKEDEAQKKDSKKTTVEERKVVPESGSEQKESELEQKGSGSEQKESGWEQKESGWEQKESGLEQKVSLPEAESVPHAVKRSSVASLQEMAARVVPPEQKWILRPDAKEFIPKKVKSEPVVLLEKQQPKKFTSEPVVLLEKQQSVVPLQAPRVSVSKQQPPVKEESRQRKSPEPEEASSSEASELSLKFAEWKEKLEKERRSNPETWSPANVEGKKVYSREVIFAVCQEIMVFTQSEIAEENRDCGYESDVVCGFLNQTRNKPRFEQQSTPPPPPKHQKHFLHSQQSKSPMHKGNIGRGGRVPKAEMPPRLAQQRSRGGQKVIERQPKAAVQLNKADTAWKPKTSEQLSREEMMKKKTRGILNKITPQTEEELTTDFLHLLFDELMLDTPDANMSQEEAKEKQTADWAIIIEVIFGKAVEEQNFCELYSKICLSVVTRQLRTTHNCSTFRNLLLSTSQAKFESFQKGHSSQEEENSAQDLEEMRVERRSVFGNIRFIGELYQQGLLVPVIIHYCITELFRRLEKGFEGNKQAEEDTLDCLCRLLTTTGKKLSSDGRDKFEENMEKYFIKLQEHPPPSFRAKFMIINLLELRENGWEARRKQDGPKKLEEVHRDHKLEKLNEKRDL